MGHGHVEASLPGGLRFTLDTEESIRSFDRAGRHPPKVIGSPWLFNANRLKRSTASTKRSLALALRDTRNRGTRSGASATHKSTIPTET